MIEQQEWKAKGKRAEALLNTEFDFWEYERWCKWSGFAYKLYKTEGYYALIVVYETLEDLYEGERGR